MAQQGEQGPEPLEKLFKAEQIKFTAKIGFPQCTYSIQETENPAQRYYLFSNGESYLAQNDNGIWYAFISEQIGPDIQQRIVQLNAVHVEQQQQQQQQQQDNVQHLIIDIVDVTRKQNFSGSITDEYITGQTNDQENLESILDFIRDNIENALNPQSPFYVKLEKELCEITIKIMQQTNKKNAQRKEFILSVPMNKQVVDEQVIENIKEKNLTDKIDEQINGVKQQIDKLQQQVTDLATQQNGILAGVDQSIQQSQQYTSQTVSQLQNQIAQAQQNQQSSQQIDYLQGYVQQMQETINNQQQQIEYLNHQLNGLLNKPQPTQVQLNNQAQLQNQEDPESRILFMSLLQSDQLTEFQFKVEEDEQDYSVGILEGGDLDNLGNKNKAIFIEFPEGKLTRGSDDAIRFLPRQVLRNDLVGIKVDRNAFKFTVSLNGQDLPPLNLKEGFDQFSFVVKTKTELPLLDIISQ